jgi:hypothetical protein
MRGRAPGAAALAALALAACGSASQPAPHAESAPERVQSACGNLKARLEGIVDAQDFRDPQPHALRGRLPAARVAQGSLEAGARSREATAELRAVGATPRSLEAIAGAEAAYRLLAQHLRHARARDGSAGLEMQFSFLTIDRAEVAGCDAPTG